MEKHCLSIDEVAEYLGIAAPTVYRLVQDGHLPGFKVGGQWRFDPAILEHWIQEQSSHPQNGNGNGAPHE